METKTVDWSKNRSSLAHEGDPCFQKMKTANEIKATLKTPNTTQLPRWLPAAPQPLQSSEPLNSFLPALSSHPWQEALLEDVLIEPSPAQVMAVQGAFCFCSEQAACTTFWQHTQVSKQGISGFTHNTRLQLLQYLMHTSRKSS